MGVSILVAIGRRKRPGVADGSCGPVVPPRCGPLADVVAPGYRAVVSVIRRTAIVAPGVATGKEAGDRVAKVGVVDGRAPAAGFARNAYAG